MPKARDHRGRLVDICDPWSPMWLQMRDEIPQRQAARIRERIGTGLKLIAYVQIPILILAVMYIVGMFWSKGGEAWTMGRVWLKFFQVLLVVAVLVCFWLVATKKRVRRTIQVMLSESRCPSCAYDLSGARSATNGTVRTCPECGAEWQFAQVSPR